MTSDSTSLESIRNRWRLNKRGQLVTDVASADWDITDEIIRLKNTDVVGEGKEVLFVSHAAHPRSSSSSCRQQSLRDRFQHYLVT